LINDVSVGTGKWQGRLPIGPHQLEVREAGYHGVTQTIQSTREARTTTTVKLEVDDNHPRWGIKEVGVLWLEAFGGPAISRSFHSDAESYCGGGSCPSDPPGLGFLLGARIGYEFPPRVSVELAGGYLSLSKTQTRNIERPLPVGSVLRTASYEITDELHIAGGFAGIGASYRHPFGNTAELRSRLLIGALFPRSRDELSGTVSGGGNTVNVYADHSGTSVGSVDLFVMPELRLGFRFGHFDIGLGLGAAFFLINGPTFETGDVKVDSTNCGKDSALVDCVKGQDFAQQERAYRQFLVWLPTLSAGYAF